MYSQASEAAVSHFRTKAGDREIDLTVSRDDQRAVAIEVKLSASVTDADVRRRIEVLRTLAAQEYETTACNDGLRQIVVELLLRVSFFGIEGADTSVDHGILRPGQREVTSLNETSLPQPTVIAIRSTIARA